MDNNTSLLPASALAFTPAHTLKKKTIENAKVIGHLESLIRAEKIELGRLLAKQTTLTKRARSSQDSPSQDQPASSTTQGSLTPDSFTLTKSPTSPITYTDDYLKHSALSTHSPKGIMHSFSSPAPPSHSSSVEAPASSSPGETRTNHNNQQDMAARGSHWSFIEKARFEAAMLKYGPFAWDDIIKAVGTRTEKQVKAYAARYRRRKKLAAKMHALPIMSYPEVTAHMSRSSEPSVVPKSTPASQQPTRAEPHLQTHSQTSQLPIPIQPAMQLSTQPSTEAPMGSEGTWDVRPSDVFTEPSSQNHNESYSSMHAPAPISDGRRGVDMFGHAEGDISQDMLARCIKGTKHDLVPDTVLSCADVQSTHMSEIPSEVDLLVDQALASHDLGVPTGKPVVEQLEEDPYNRDFGSTWFEN